MRKKKKCGVSAAAAAAHSAAGSFLPAIVCTGCARGVDGPRTCAIGCTARGAATTVSQLRTARRARTGVKSEHVCFHFP